MLRHVNRYTQRERKAGHLQRIQTFLIPSPPGCWRTPPAQTLLHAKALLYPANTYNWIRWNIQQPLTSLSFYHWDNTSKPFIKRQLYIQKKEHVGKTLCKTTPVLSLNGDAPALQLNVILWAREAHVAFASVTLPAAPAASNLPVWVPFQDTGELQINSSNSWSLQNGKNNRWDDSLWRNAYFYSQTDLLLRDCASCVSWEVWSHLQSSLGENADTLPTSCARETGTNTCVAAKFWVSEHTQIWSCAWGQKRGLLCGDKHLFPFSFARSICTGSRELMEGVRWEVVGALAFQCPPPPPLRSEGLAVPLLEMVRPSSSSSLLWSGSACLLQTKSGGEKTR